MLIIKSMLNVWKISLIYKSVFNNLNPINKEKAVSTQQKVEDFVLKSILLALSDFTNSSLFQIS